jgi:hypothetical protein
LVDHFTANKMAARRALTSRPIDLFYFIFFLVREIASTTPQSKLPDIALPLPPLLPISAAAAKYPSWQLTHLSHFQNKKKPLLK